MTRNASHNDGLDGVGLWWVGKWSEGRRTLACSPRQRDHGMKGCKLLLGLRRRPASHLPRHAPPVLPIHPRSDCSSIFTLAKPYTNYSSSSSRASLASTLASLGVVCSRSTWLGTQPQGARFAIGAGRLSRSARISMQCAIQPVGHFVLTTDLISDHSMPQNFPNGSGRSQVHDKYLTCGHL